jgi:hypothetical protein
MNNESMNGILEQAKRKERHRTNAETRYWCDQYKQIATEAVKALANQEQGEPVAWRRLSVLGFDYIEHISSLDGMVSEEWKPLYDTPQQRKPLTEQEFESCIMKARGTL